MVDISTLQPLFGLPQEEASKLLGISVTAMKQLCRKLGVGRWPYQKPTHKEMVNITTYKTSEPLEDVSETCSFSLEEVDFFPLPTDPPIFDMQPSISSQPSWDSEGTTETASEILIVDMEYGSETENELEGLLEPEPSLIDPYFSLL